VLIVLLVGSALLVGASPHIFHWATEGLNYVGGKTAWAGYVVHAFASAALVMLLPGLLLGSVFPFLMKVSEAFKKSTGRTIGDLLAMNTVGAIAGSLAAGFLLLGLMGLWASIELMAALYVLAAVSLAWGGAAVRRSRAIAAAGSALFILLWIGTVKMPVVRADHRSGEEKVLKVWEGSAATVAVVEKQRRVDSGSTDDPVEHNLGHRSSLRIKVNNYYNLGGTDSKKWEEWQSHLPLFLHPDPRSVFFLGMGTGITAGAALDHPAERIVVSEIVPEVVEAARTYFTPYLNGLFKDPRVQVVAEDGRNYLLGTEETFDLVIADLFMPWKAGTSSLYTREHYAAALSRLNKHGLFAQWLPLHQMSRQEFGIIARTMLDVFPLVTLWRGDFFSLAPIVALIGHSTPEQLDPAALRERLAALPQYREMPLSHFVPDAPLLTRRAGMPSAGERFLLYYCMNISRLSEYFREFQINSDDRPLIEYRAPISQRLHEAGKTNWFVGQELLHFLELGLKHSPPEHDPYLQRNTPRAQQHVQAGLYFYRAQILGMAGEDAIAQQVLGQFMNIVFKEN
jgi:spermidine synthase